MQFYSKAKAYYKLVVFLSNWSDTEVAMGDCISAVKLLKECNTYGKKMVKWDDTDLSKDIATKMYSLEQSILANDSAATGSFPNT